MKKLLLVLSLLVMSFFVVSCETPSVQVEGITITSEENVRTIKVNETLQLTAKVFPEGAVQTVTWESSDQALATVDAQGLVTAVAKGNVNIKATSTENAEISQTFAIIIEEAEEVVVDPTSVSITASATTCKAGETISLSATVLPAEANQSVTWVSSDTSVATVNRGEVSALKEGTVVITVFAKGYENISDSVTLTIEPGEGPIVSKDWATMEYSTHEYYMTAEKESPLKVKGVVTHVSPVKDGKVTYVLQNGTEGYYVYAQDVAAFPVELGKVYEVGGFKKYYNGLNEIVNVEYFKELSENIEYAVNSLEGLDPTDLTAMEPYHCSIVSGAAILESASVASKAFSFYGTVNGYSTTFRVDPSYMSAEEFSAICDMLSQNVSGASFEFQGIMTAFGYGKASPQIMITKAENLKFAEMSTADLLEAAAASIKIVSSIPLASKEIELPKAVEGFDGLTVAWKSSSELINVETGVVSHGASDEDVVLTATLSLEGETLEATFEVLVFAEDNAVYETVVSFDLEDALPAGSYGNSESKSSYKEGNVTLGTPAYTWMLRNALIAATNSDIREGAFSIRAQVNKEAASTARIEILQDVDFSVLEFAVATYGNDANGTQIRVEYSTDSGTTWQAHETVVSVDSNVLTTYRFKLPEGANRVAIVLVENSGRRVNIDNIKLMK